MVRLVDIVKLLKISYSSLLSKINGAKRGEKVCIFRNIFRMAFHF